MEISRGLTESLWGRACFKPLDVLKNFDAKFRNMNFRRCCQMATSESLVLIKATEVGLEVMELSRIIIVLFGIGITFVRSIKLSLLYRRSSCFTLL